MSKLILKDDAGEVEIDGEALMDLLHNTFQLAAAFTVEQLTRSDQSPQDNKRTVQMTRRVEKLSWGDDKWCERFVSHIFTFCRERPDKKEKE